MIGRDLFVDRDIADADLVTVIAQLFGINPDEVLLVGDANPWPTGDIGRVRVIGERWHWSGEFPLKLELHPQHLAQEKFLKAHACDELTNRLLTLLGARGLVPDEDDDGLYGYLLLEPGQRVEHVRIDGDRLEDDGAIVLARRHAPVST